MSDEPDSPAPELPPEMVQAIEQGCEAIRDLESGPRGTMTVEEWVETIRYYLAPRLAETERSRGDREREATTRAIATAMRAEPRRWYLRVCPCGAITSAGTPCAGFPGAWDDEMGDFARSACLGEVVEVEEVADAPAEAQEDER